ncbi:response regulator, partial [bacterium]|nr:response regulator [bacterium]
MSKGCILVVDDDLSVRTLCVDLLEKEGYKVHDVESGEQALEFINNNNYNLLLLDINLPNINGVEVLKRVKNNHFQCEVIMMTAYGNVKTAVESMRLGAYDYISKPFDVKKFALLISHCLEKQNLVTEVSELKEIAALYNLSKAMNSTMNPEELLNLILKSACKSLQADGGSLILIDQKKKELTVRNYLMMVDDKILTKKVRVNEKIGDLKNKMRESGIMTERWEMSEYFEFEEEVESVKSRVIVPLIIKDEVIGIVNLKRLKEDKRFVEQDMKLLSIFAKDAALAIENTRAYRALEDAKINLEEDVKERTKELLKAQEQLVQSEKMSALGQLAAGVAHQLRNPLYVIMSAVQFCLSKFNLEKEVKKNLEVILRNIENADKVVKELLEFARPSKVNFHSLSITEVLNKVCQLIHPRCSNQNVQVVKQFCSSLPELRIDKDHLEQAFFNFTINSLQAMPKGGVLTIKTSLSSKKKEVVVEFIDTGYGISEKCAKEIFNPFFTTKSDGVGLGMSIAHQVVVGQHKGRIEV